MTDTTAPKLINFKLPATIDLSKPGAKISFQVEAADEAGGSGLSMVSITLDRFVSGGTQTKHITFRPGISSADGQLVATDSFADATPNTAAIDFNVGPGSPSGTVRIASIRVFDKAGMVSTYTAAQLEALGFNATVELVNSSAPAAPTASVITSGVEVGSTARTFEGTGQVGNKVFVSAFVDGLYKTLGSATVGADGKWTLQAGALSDGIYTKAVAWAVDSAGNASTVSQPFAFDVWKDGLSAPKFTLPTDAQGLLRVDNPVVTGSGVPQAVVTLYADGKVVGTGKVDDGGNWSIMTSTLSPGAHSFTAMQATAGGRTSMPTAPANAAVAVVDTGLKFSVSSLSASGVTSDQAFIQNMLDDVAARFSEFIDANVTIPVSVSIRDMGTAVGSAGANVRVDAAGVPVVTAAQLNLNSKYPGLFSASDMVNPYLYAHELVHVLGFNGAVSAFQKFVEVRSDGIYFVGPNAMALNGGAVRLSDESHLHGDGDLMGSGGGRLDSPVHSPSNPYAPFSQLDIAMLKDIGWTTKPVLVSDDGHTFIAGSGKAGFDQVDGTAGLDTFFINQNRAVLNGSWVSGEYVLRNSANGTSHSLSGIERVQFADATVALDVNGVGGQVYRLYQAVFGRQPDKSGLGFWINAMDNGLSLSRVADEFATSPEFAKLYGSAPTSEEVITKLYANVLHRAPDQGGFDFWNTALKANPGLVKQFVVEFSESAENREQVAKIIGNGFEFDSWA
jgi:hypothetical protein